MKALIAVELHVDAKGKPTCRGCGAFELGHCMTATVDKNGDFINTKGTPHDRCLTFHSEANAAVTEAERLLTDVLEGGYCTVRLKRALAALKKARE